MPLSITPTVWYMQGGTARSVDLAKFDLLPSETRPLDVISLLSASGLKNYSGSFNLVFDTNGKPGSLLLASGSVDQTNTYVFEAMPHFIAEGGGKSMQYWSIGNGDDTMVTVWNPADEGQDFVITLFYTGGKYAKPLHLEPRATRTFNVSEIVHSQIPDAAGNVVPAGVQEGGFKIAGSIADNQSVLVGIDAGVYNVRKATCGGVCSECDGYTTSSTVDTSFAVAVSGNHQESAYANWNTGGQYNITGNASWSSNHTNIATVSNSGGTKGRATGVSPGSFRASWILTNAPVGAGYICHSDQGCPVTTIGDGGDGTTTPTVTISGPNKIPMLNTGTQGPDSIQLTASPSPSGGTFVWSATSGGSSITILNSTSQTATIESRAAGNATIQVQYTLNGQTAAATANVKVQLPSRLGVVSDSESVQDFLCGGVPFLCGVRRDILYQVEEADGTPVAAAMPVTETFTAVSNSCSDVPNTPTPTSGTTDGTGTFPDFDRLALKSGFCLPADANGVPQGSCTLVVNQRWFANGYSAAFQKITYACRSITLVPLQ
jgi:hypothetical protein